MKKHLLMLCFVLAVCLTAVTGCGGGGGGGGGYIPPASETGSISGKIVNNTVAVGSGNIKAAAAATEEVKVYLEQNPEISAVADAQGNFLLENVPAGNVFIIAEHRTPAGLLFRIRSPEITVEPAKISDLTASPLEVKVADQTFSGRVINKKTKAPVSGVSINVWGKNSQTETDGTFVIENLVNINIPYSIKFFKNGFEAFVKGARLSDVDAQLMEIELVPLPDSGSVVGKLAANGPVQGVSVICEQYPDIKTVTDSQGQFKLENIPAGKVRLIATAPFGKSLMRGSVEVTITAGQQTDISGSPVTMSVHSKAVHGIIDIPGHSDKISGITVSALGQSVLSNDIGYFKIEHLPAERIIVTFEKAGLVKKTVEVDLTSVTTVNLTPLAMEVIKPEDIPETDIPLKSIEEITAGMNIVPQADNNTILLNVEAVVRLPENAKVRRRDLHSLTTDSIDKIDPDGFIVTRSFIGSSSPALVIVGTKPHFGSEQVDPLLLKIWHPKDAALSRNDQYIDSSSTAEALVLVDNVFWSLPHEKFLDARSRIRKHAAFPSLVRSIEYALQTADSQMLFRDALVRGSHSIAKDVAKAMSVTPEPLTSSMRFSAAAAEKQVFVEDDAKRNTASVNLVNRSYCHYTVEVKKGTVAVPSEFGNYWVLPRSTHTSITWTWPPERKIQVPVSIGAGEFDFKFTRNTKLSIFDGFMTLAGTVIGTGASTYKELDDAYKILATTGGGLIDMINKAATANVNSAADARKLADELLFSSGKMGFELLMDFAPKYFGDKLKRQFKSSWFKTAAKFMASKALIWGVAAYNTTEVALIIYDAVNAPEFYEEKGWQTTAGWYGDLFSEKIEKMNKMRVVLSLPVAGTAHYKDSTSAYVSNNSILSFQSPVVDIQYQSVSKVKRELTDVTYGKYSGGDSISLVIPKLGFSGFKNRFGSTPNAFDENSMEFVYSAQQSGLVTINNWTSGNYFPNVPNFSDFSYWVFDRILWENVSTGIGYHIGVVLTP